MSQASEQIAKQYANAAVNKKNWGDIAYNVLVEGLSGDGVSDDTAKLQALINKAIAADRRTILFPHGQYYVTALTGADQVDFIGDNSSFVGGYTGTISNLGGFAELDVEFNQLKDEAVTAINAVTGYDADPTGVTDSTTELQAAATAATGKTLFIPPGNYLISSMITIPVNTTVMAYGARIFNTTAMFTFLKLSSNVDLFGLELEGIGNSAYNAASNAVDISGVSAVSPNTDILIRDCYIHDFRGWGVLGEFNHRVKVENCKIERMGYAGVGIASAIDCHVYRCKINDISPGLSASMYGIYFSARNDQSDRVTYPLSQNCSATFNSIDNINYEAIDTHGGINMDFSHNIITNCKVGCAFVPNSNSSVQFVYGAHYARCIGNHITGRQDPTQNSYGIVIQGGTEPTSRDYAKDPIIHSNHLYRCSLPGNSTAGAIQVNTTKNASIMGNTLRECYAVGINVYTQNYGFSVVGNAIIDQQDPTFTTPCAIGLRSSPNEGVISGNVCRRETPGLNTYVMEVGLLISTPTTQVITVGPNQFNATTPLSGVIGSHVDYGTFGLAGAKMYSSNGTPEGAITAGIGSICVNPFGGASTTFYVKQSGTGNTGWIGK